MQNARNYGGENMDVISEKVRMLEQENEDLKEEMEKIRQIYGDDYKPMRCQDCIHFCQHYGKCGNHYFRLNDGHCTVGKRTKSKKAEDERCQFFETGTSNMRVFRRKERGL